MRVRGFMILPSCLPSFECAILGKLLVSSQSVQVRKVGVLFLYYQLWICSIRPTVHLKHAVVIIIAFQNTRDKESLIVGVFILPLGVGGSLPSRSAARMKEPCWFQRGRFLESSNPLGQTVSVDPTNDKTHNPPGQVGGGGACSQPTSPRLPLINDLCISILIYPQLQSTLGLLNVSMQMVESNTSLRHASFKTKNSLYQSLWTFKWWHFLMFTLGKAS